MTPDQKARIQDAIRHPLRDVAMPFKANGTYWHDVLDAVKEAMLRHEASVSGGNQVKMARRLGINRNTLRSELLRLTDLRMPGRGRPGR